MKTAKELLYDLFATAFEFMFFSSGDGVSLIISDDYIGIADLFEEWANDNHPNYFKKIIDKEHNDIIFEGTDAEEAIIFEKDLGEYYHNMYEFISILPNWYLSLAE